MAVSSIWQGLPISLRLKIRYAHSCKTLDVPNTLSPRITPWEYVRYTWDFLFSSPFPRWVDFKDNPTYVLGFFVYWTAVVIIIGIAVLAVRSC